MKHGKRTKKDHRGLDPNWKYNNQDSYFPFEKPVPKEPTPINVKEG